LILWEILRSSLLGLIPAYPSSDVIFSRIIQQCSVGLWGTDSSLSLSFLYGFGQKKKEGAYYIGPEEEKETHGQWKL
jgi:hypothetical protein